MRELNLAVKLLETLAFILSGCHAHFVVAVILEDDRIFNN